VQSVGPAVQAGMMPGPTAVKLLQAFSRPFKLGREAESVMDEWSTTLEQQAAQPPQPPPPDPKAEAAKVKAQADVAKVGMDMQAAQAKHGMDMEKLAAETQAQQVRTQLDMQKLEAEVVAASMAPPLSPYPPSGGNRQ
jgi:hypothetical protein